MPILERLKIKGFIRFEKQHSEIIKAIYRSVHKLDEQEFKTAVENLACLYWSRLSSEDVLDNGACLKWVRDFWNDLPDKNHDIKVWTGQALMAIFMGSLKIFNMAQVEVAYLGLQDHNKRFPSDTEPGRFLQQCQMKYFCGGRGKEKMDRILPFISKNLPVTRQNTQKYRYALHFMQRHRDKYD